MPSKTSLVPLIVNAQPQPLNVSHMAKINTRSQQWYGWLPDLPDHRDFTYSAIKPALAGVAPTGHGFVNMADRLGAIGGTVRWLSEPGHGSQVRGSIPLAQD